MSTVTATPARQLMSHSDAKRHNGKLLHYTTAVSRAGGERERDGERAKLAQPQAFCLLTGCSRTGGAGEDAQGARSQGS
eukprot:scaffold61690_cov26-Tisochrysis_lutea.AAC.1